MWISQLDAEFQLLTDAGIITEEVAHPFTYNYLSIEDGQCQTYEFKGTIPDGAPASVCHGKGYFVTGTGEYRVLFNQGSIVKVLLDKPSGERVAFTCRDDCAEYHGPYSSIYGGSENTNIMVENCNDVG